jgi:hypothetical protein
MKCKNAGTFSRRCLDASQEKHKSFIMVRGSLAKGSKKRERDIICLETFKGI